VWNATLPVIPDADALRTKWQRILRVRGDVLRELETLRQGGSIGSSLEAEVTISVPDDDYAALASLANDLRFVMITSAARVERGDAQAIAVNRTAQSKCERCWHWRDDVGNDSAHPAICGRCVANLYGAGEPRTFA
jgi:isoleucyl-tRNA synthetase